MPRRPIDPWVRVLPHLEVIGNPDLTMIPSLPTIPETWPDDFHHHWIWKGRTVQSQIRHTWRYGVGGYAPYKDPCNYVAKPRPIMFDGKKQVNVQNWIYKTLVQPIPIYARLQRVENVCVHSLCVNPLCHKIHIPPNSSYFAQDFEDVRETYRREQALGLQSNEQIEQQDFDDLVALIEESRSLHGRQPIAYYRAKFEPVGFTPSVVQRAFTHCYPEEGII
jgi:hypothetical protein